MMRMEHQPNKYLFLFVGGLSIIFLVLYTLLGSHPLIHDEPWYLSNVSLLEQHRISKEFLERLAGPAGPTHAVLFYLLKPITGDNLIAIRMVNVILSIICLPLFYIIIRNLNNGYTNDKIMRLNKAFGFFSIPMTIAASGMAITNIPAIFFSLLGLLFLIKSLHKRSWPLAIAGGLVMSLAILGRQPYLVVLLALPFLLLNGFDKKKVAALVIFAVSLAFLPTIVFYIWQGLVPKLGGSDATRINYKPEHFFLGLGYAFGVSLLIAPSFFPKPKKRFALIYAFSFSIILFICHLLNYQWTIFNFVFVKLIPVKYHYPIKIFTSAVLITIGLYFLSSLVFRMHENRKNNFYIFCGIASFLILLTCIKVTHLFSSFYVLQTAPFLVILLSYHMKFTTTELLFRLIGTILGIVSLMSYFKLGSATYLTS